MRDLSWIRRQVIITTRLSVIGKVQFLQKKGKKLLNSDETSTLQTDKD